MTAAHGDELHLPFIFFFTFSYLLLLSITFPSWQSIWLCRCLDTWAVGANRSWWVCHELWNSSLGGGYGDTPFPQWAHAKTVPCVRLDFNDVTMCKKRRTGRERESTHLKLWLRSKRIWFVWLGQTLKRSFLSCRNHSLWPPSSRSELGQIHKISASCLFPGLHLFVLFGDHYHDFWHSLCL